MALADAVPFAVAHWNLDEASGTRVDSIGSNDLTDNNTVGSASGMFGNAADFEADNSEHLSCADDAALGFDDNDEWMLRFWVKLESKSASQVFVGKWDATRQEYIVQFAQGSDAFQLIIRGSDNGTIGDPVYSLSPSVGTWYLIHAWWSKSANQVGIAVNAGTASTQTIAGTATSGDRTFHIGSTSTPNTFADALIDDVVLIKGYILDATERTEDYNGGTGVAFADWAGAVGSPWYYYAQQHAVAG